MKTTASNPKKRKSSSQQPHSALDYNTIITLFAKTLKCPLYALWNNKEPEQPLLELFRQVSERILTAVSVLMIHARDAVMHFFSNMVATDYFDIDAIIVELLNSIKHNPFNVAAISELMYHLCMHRDAEQQENLVEDNSLLAVLLNRVQGMDFNNAHDVKNIASLLTVLGKRMPALMVRYVDELKYHLDYDPHHIRSAVVSIFGYILQLQELDDDIRRDLEEEIIRRTRDVSGKTRAKTLKMLNRYGDYFLFCNVTLNLFISGVTT